MKFEVFGQIPKMKDKSLILLPLLLLPFLIIGSLLIYKPAKNDLPERIQAALETQDLGKFIATFNGDDIYLLGEATSQNKLSRAEQAVSGVVADNENYSVNTDYVTVLPPLESPYVSLAIIGDTVVASGRVLREEIREAIIASLGNRFPNAEIDTTLFKVCGNLQDIPGFANVAKSNALDLSADQLQHGTLASIGEDSVWTVTSLGSDYSTISAELEETIPAEFVPTVLNEAKDLMVEHQLRNELLQTRQALAAKTNEAEALAAVVAKTNLELKQIKRELEEVDGELALAEKQRAILNRKLEVSKQSIAVAKAETEDMARAKEAALVRIDELEAKLKTVSGELASQTRLLNAALTEGNLIAEKLKQSEVQAEIVELGLRSEVQRLRGELDQVKAAASSSEFPRLGTIRMLPDSVTGSITDSPEREGQLDSARVAAAEGASRAREAARESVDKAEETRNQSAPKIEDLSSEVSPGNHHKFNLKRDNESNRVNPGERFKTEINRRIQQLEFLMNQQQKADGDVIAKLQAEVDSLRALLPGNSSTQTGGSSANVAEAWLPNAASVAIR